jgi:hypothetical protein
MALSGMESQQRSLGMGASRVKATFKSSEKDTMCTVSMFLIVETVTLTLCRGI